MKKYIDFTKDYVKRLNDEDLKFINNRLTQRLGGDIADVVSMVQQTPEMDRWFASAGNAVEFFDIVDTIDNCVQQEIKRRFVKW